MVLIRFPDATAKRAALGWLPGRFSFRSWTTGRIRVPIDALASLAVKGIPFTVVGPEDA